MSLSKVIVSGFALTLICGTALAQNQVSDYLRDGWDVKGLGRNIRIALRKNSDGAIFARNEFMMTDAARPDGALASPGDRRCSHPIPVCRAVAVS